MIKCDFGKQTAITGHAIQIAAELECLAREEELLIAKTESPELAKRAKEYTDMLMKELFGVGTSKHDSVEEE